jgi:hypothetical protein
MPTRGRIGLWLPSPAIQVAGPHGLLLSDGSAVEHGRDAGAVLLEPGELSGEAQVGAALVGLGAEQDLEPVLVDGAEGRRAGGRAVVLHRLIGHTQQAGHAVPGQEQRTQPDHAASDDQDWGVDRCRHGPLLGGQGICAHAPGVQLVSSGCGIGSWQPWMRTNNPEAGAQPLAERGASGGRWPTVAFGPPVGWRRRWP